MKSVTIKGLTSALMGDPFYFYPSNRMINNLLRLAGLVSTAASQGYSLDPSATSTRTACADPPAPIGHGVTGIDPIRMRAFMDEIYGAFKKHVTETRGNRLKKPIDELAGGRVYTGKQSPMGKKPYGKCQLSSTRFLDAHQTWRRKTNANTCHIKNENNHFPPKSPKLQKDKHESYENLINVALADCRHIRSWRY
jgi:hypothetical protein